MTPMKPDGQYPAQIKPADEDFLEQIYNIYGSMSAFRLSELTHEPGGPWATARKWRGWYAEIPDQLIKVHYIGKRYVAKKKDEK